jgi:hypothetical protein
MRATETHPTRRRSLHALAGLAATLASPAVWAAPEQAALGKPWRLPPDTRHELRPAAHGMTLAQALRAVQEWQVPVSSQLLIQLEDGVHAQARAITWRHADGARIQVLGNTADPTRCKLQWADSGDGFYVGAGQVLGGLDGVTLVQTGQGTPGSGLLADEGGVVLCGRQVQIDGFYYSVQARRNGSARCEGLRASGGGDANFFAFMGGHIHARRSLSVGARDDAKKLGSGYVAEYGGSIDAEGAVARLNALDGFTALSNGVIRAYGSRAERNGRSGYFTDTGGRIVGHDAVADSNCGDGVVTRDGARAITGERIGNHNNNAPAPSCRTTR